MRKEREELRRGIRAFIQDASIELAEFTNAPPVAEVVPPAEPMREAVALDRPLLRLVRDAPTVAGPVPPRIEDIRLRLPKKGVCVAYFINKRCWELPDAFCNHALHVCRLRECPVYDLHQSEMEARFAEKFKYLW